MRTWKKFLLDLLDTKVSEENMSNPILHVLKECGEFFPGFRTTFWSVNTRRNEIKIHRIESDKNGYKTLVMTDKALSQFQFEKSLRSKNRVFYSFKTANRRRILIPLFVDGSLSGCVSIASSIKTPISIWKARLPYFFIASKQLLKLLELDIKNTAIDTLMELNQNLEHQVSQKDLWLEQEKLAHLQASKMATLGEVAAGIAHEINNPLTIIMSRIGFLEKKLEKVNLLDPEFASSIAKINLTIERIVKIINGLRYFAHSGSDKKSNVSLARVISDSLELCQERVKKNDIELRVLKPTFDVEVSAHDTQLIQVVLNLIINSLDAIKGLSDKWIEIEYKIEKDHLKLIVRDSGSGVPAEVANKIMNPFYTTKERGEGTGLGLSLSKTIIENHEGRLFYNAEATNTEFIIELPYMRTI